MGRNTSIHLFIVLSISLSLGIILLCGVSILWYFVVFRLKISNRQIQLEEESNGLPLIPIGPSRIHSLEKIGKGRCGFVYRAKVGNSEDTMVAVKIFPIEKISSYSSEVSVYQLPHLKHENILQFLGQEWHSKELWLIMEYYEHKSLYDHLKNHTISLTELLTIAKGISRGLEFLHDDLQFHDNPTIAHRDIKSENILIKPKSENNWIACIADFDLALIFKTNEPPDGIEVQVGTPRYMAPEVLQGSIIFKKEYLFWIDMYACGLVLWELISRCSLNLSFHDYQLPYEEEINQLQEEIAENCLPVSDQYPIRSQEIEKYKKIVHVQKKRPIMKESWRKKDSVLGRICEMIDHLLDEVPEARLTSANVAVVFEKLQS